MASLASIDFKVNTEGFYAGAAFRLVTPAMENSTVVLAGGATVRVYDGMPYLIVNLPEATVTSFSANALPRQVLAASYEAAQCALDIVAMDTLAEDLALRDVNEKSIVWWRRSRKVTLQLSIRKDSAFAEVAASRPTSAPPQWDPAFRYFRLSRVSNDLYDGYRNMWLALESVLSTLEHKRPDEMEDEWLYRTLQRVHEDLTTHSGWGLEKFTGQAGTDPVRVFIDEQYRAERCSIFHAKKGHKPTVPGSLQRREQLGSSSVLLDRLVSELARRYLSGRRGMSGVIPPIFEGMVSKIAQDMSMGLFEQDIPEVDNQLAVARDLPHNDLQVTFHRSFDGSGFEHAIVGRVQGYPLWGKNYVCVALYNEGLVLSKDSLESLSLNNVDTFETVMVFGAINKGEPRTRFAL